MLQQTASHWMESPLDQPHKHLGVRMAGRFLGRERAHVQRNAIATERLWQKIEYSHGEKEVVIRTAQCSATVLDLLTEPDLR